MILFIAAIPCALVLALFDAFATRVIITVVRVDVLPTEPDGDAWDGKHGLPDPQIVLTQGRHEVARCEQVHDKLGNACTPDAEASPRRPLHVKVTDVDLASDDLIGELDVDLPPGGGVVVREHIEGIAKLALTIEPRASAGVRYRSRLTATGIGALLALLAWIGLVRRWLAAEPEAPPITVGGVRVITWLAGALVFVGLVVGVGSMFTGSGSDGLLFEAPCGFGAAAVGLVWLHGRARGRLTTMDAMLMFLGIGAVLIPILIKAALIVCGIAFLYVVVVGLWQSIWD